VQSIDEIEIAAHGGAISLPAESWHLDGQAVPPPLILKDIVPPAPDAVAQGVAIEFTAGFGHTAADVPAPIRQALLLLIAHWFENREPAITGPAGAGIYAVLGPEVKITYTADWSQFLRADLISSPASTVFATSKH